jgi:hypothetical protein
MGSLRLRFKKKADADAVLTALRPDGSSTSTTIGAPCGFGPMHDLTHFVVETSMGFKNGFLGLLAAGRSVEDFDRGAKHWLPEEAMIAEAIAGQLSQDAMTNNPLNVEVFNWTIRDVLTRGTVKALAPELSADQLAGMRARLADLRSRWDALPPGETLELEVSS